MRCSDCGKETPDGQHCCVWFDDGESVKVRFVCMECSHDYEDITEMMEAMSEVVEHYQKDKPRR